MSSQANEFNIASKILLFIGFSVIAFFLTCVIFLLIAASMGTEIFNIGEQISMQLSLWLLIGWIFFPAILFGVILVYLYVRIVGGQIIERKREEDISRRLIARRLREKNK
ncbi:MAG: hypothetical protein ACFFC7_20520 [Candidatus Hermodarchaeota archaeon]